MSEVALVTVFAGPGLPVSAELSLNSGFGVAFEQRVFDQLKIHPICPSDVLFKHYLNNYLVMHQDLTVENVGYYKLVEKTSNSFIFCL